jgi:hypothetical protein
MRQRFALENILRRCFGSPSIVIAVYCSNNFSIPTEFSIDARPIRCLVSTNGDGMCHDNIASSRAIRS